MQLPKNLISEFVKVTNNTTKTKTETTVYGSIVKDNGATYVKLDGSDVLTPVSTTTDAQTGERVTVMIKNHTATVTGNISSPAARTDDVQQLGIGKLDINSAESTYATIDNLAVANAKISELEATIEDARKTATNFLDFDSANGLQVGDKSGGVWSGFRARITLSAFDILDKAGDTLASYGAKLIELGKNATDAVIRLCGGNGQIKYVTDSDTSNNYLQISSNKLRLSSDSMTSLYSSETASSGEVNRSAVNVTPSSVYVYSGSSNISIIPTQIDVTAPGDLTINVSSFRDSYGQFLSVEEGSSGNWSYRKFSNGDVELWGSYTVSGVPCSTSFGSSMYRSDALTMPAFPFSVYNPNLTASYESDGYGAMLWAIATTTETSPPSYYLIRIDSSTIVSGKINFHVNGKWTT